MALKISVRYFHRLSNIFQPQNILPKNAKVKQTDLTSKSQKLMLDLGYIRPASPGCYHLLPLTLRSLQKLITIVDEEMKNIGGQKLVLPTFTSAKLWEATGRLNSGGKELFTLQDRHQQSYVVSPTHEEAACDLISSLSPISYKQLPLKLYQITEKFRDEIKPRFGLLRGKQFLMKDMYSFDTSLESARSTYYEICQSYHKIFQRIGVNFIQVFGSSGQMGGNHSHEFHYLSDIGEDKILNCLKCKYSANVELLSSANKCPKCDNTDVSISFGVEVGHTFLLGEKYSEPLNATFLSQEGKSHSIQMGSYGLGLTRILAAALEVLSTEKEMRWPIELAPFTSIIIPPKKGSKEELNLQDTNLVESLYYKIENLDTIFSNNVLIDDRINLTIGRRYFEAKKNGYPFIIVLGKKTLETQPLVELTDLINGNQLHLNENDLLIYLKDNYRNSVEAIANVQ